MIFNFREFESSQTRFLYRFEKENEGNLVTVECSFDYSWSLPENQLGGEDEKDKLAGVIVIDEGETEYSTHYTADLYQSFLRSYTLAIPDSEFRELFQSMITTWAKLRDCPLEVSTINHLQFPLTQILFNKEFISKEEVKELAEVVLHALVLRKVESKELPVHEKIEDDEEIDETQVFDYPMEYERKPIEEDETEDDLPFDVGEVIEEEEE